MFEELNVDLWILACAVGAISLITLVKWLFRESTPAPIAVPPTNNDTDDDESYEWVPGTSTKHIQATRDVVASMFNIPDVILVSGGLPDVKGENTSDVDLLIFADDHTGFETTFGDYLIQIKAASESKPNRTIYTIKIPSNPREINIYVTSDKNQGLRVIKHRRNELMLNNYPNLQMVAIWLKRNGRNKDGTRLDTEEAWAVALNLHEDGIDPHETLLCDDLAEIAAAEEQALENAEWRI
jgi:hypothetical protein